MSSKDRIIPSRKEILLHFDKNDAVMAQLIRKFGPIKLKRNRNYFIVLCNAIIGQQISVAAAGAITIRFNKLFNGHSPNSSGSNEVARNRFTKSGLVKAKSGVFEGFEFSFF